MIWETLEKEIYGLINTQILFYEDDGTYIDDMYLLTKDKIAEEILEKFAHSYWKSIQKKKVALQ